MFVPIHCSHVGCIYYDRPVCANWYRFFGTYDTKTFGTVIRYRCLGCGRTFSSQTFSINYYAKKIVKMENIFNQVNAGSSIRKIARSLDVHHNTVRNRISRMARNAIILHRQAVEHLPFGEDFVADGFESFCGSQYFPDNYHILVGEGSQFVYRTDYVSLRRKGKMTEVQKKKRKELECIWKPPKGQLTKSFQEICEWLGERTKDRDSLLSLCTDEKKEYARALRRSRMCQERLREHRWVHGTTNSKEPRTHWNRLFAVNYIDREIRKDMGAHARESVKFNRNVNDGMLRMNLYLFDHNYFKPYRVQYGEKRKLRHAEVAGVERAFFEIELVGFFTRRYFQRKTALLDGPERKCLERRWETPLKGVDGLVRKHLAA